MDDFDARSRLLHRELVRLVVLVAAVVAAFFLTRGAARQMIASHREDARTWYLLAAHASRKAPDQVSVTALRRAVANDPGNREYRLALASALAMTGDEDAATRILIDLRDAAPEDPEVNLQLARLEAQRHDIEASDRYYKAVLSGLWMPERAGRRREVRLELIDFLLAERQNARALPELLTLTTELTDAPDLRIRVGRLLLAAGDAARAREQFLHVLAEQPERGDALAGAGAASFALGDYARARRYLSAAPASGETRDLLDLTREVLATDPLERGLGSRERRARVRALLAQARSRLANCLSRLSQPSPHLQELAMEADTLLQKPRTAGDGARDLSEDGLDVAYRIEMAADDFCGAAHAPADRAIPLIALRHGLTSG